MLRKLWDVTVDFDGLKLKKIIEGPTPEAVKNTLLSGNTSTPIKRIEVKPFKRLIEQRENVYFIDFKRY